MASDNNNKEEKEENKQKSEEEPTTTTTVSNEAVEEVETKKMEEEEEEEPSKTDAKPAAEQTSQSDDKPKKKVASKETDKDPSIYEEKAAAAASKTQDSNNNNNNNNKNSQQEEFPAPFYCPITKKLFKDPVVMPDGTSYERSAIQDSKDHDVTKAYSNRALKAVMDEFCEMSGSSIRANIKRIQHSLRKTLSQVLEKSMIPSDEYHPLPEVYYCPITFSIIHVPVIDKEGNTFEKVAVENWIRANGSSPLTRTPCTIQELYPNHAIQDLLDLEKERTDSSIHPSIRKWKQEEPPKASDPELGGGAATATTATANHSQFPTTDAELEREMLRRRRATASLVALCFTIFLFMFALAYGGIFAVLCIAGLLFACSANNDPRDDN